MAISIYFTFQLFAQGSWYIPFILELEHVGITKEHPQLTEAAHLLSQICPSHKQTVCYNIFLFECVFVLNVHSFNYNVLLGGEIN